jgi:hypothetical protein
MINETVSWEKSKSDLIRRPHTQPLYQENSFKDYFDIRYHFNQIQNLDNSIPVVKDVKCE